MNQKDKRRYMYYLKFYFTIVCWQITDTPLTPMYDLEKIITFNPNAGFLITILGFIIIYLLSHQFTGS